MSKLKNILILAGTAAGAIGTAFGIDYLIKKYTYDADGYNGHGYDKYGFDKDGYNKHGFDRYNIDREGYDINGYNKDGYDRNGYNKLGFDNKGYDRNGYDIKGFDKEGYNRYGFDEEGYSVDGFDKSKNNKTYYKQKVVDMKNYIDKASTQINKQSYDYALQDLRKALEIGTKCLIRHHMELNDDKLSLEELIKKCKINHLCDNVLIDELFDAKRYCNDEMHDNQIHVGFKETNFTRAIALKLKAYVCNDCLAELDVA